MPVTKWGKIKKYPKEGKDILENSQDNTENAQIGSNIHNNFTINYSSD
jgi:hypothetical protein